VSETPDTIAGLLALGLDIEVRCLHCTHRAWLGIENHVRRRPELAKLTIAEILERLRCTNTWCGKRGARRIDTTQRWLDLRRVPAPLGLDALAWTNVDVAGRVEMIIGMAPDSGERP
jgi:hypothetical protein